MHRVHTPPFGPVDPALQTQSVSLSLSNGKDALKGHPWHTVCAPPPTVVEYVLNGQDMHALFPVPVEYFPATQFSHTVPVLYLPAAHKVHTPPFVPAHPVLQTQSFDASLPSGEAEFEGHPWHTLCAFPPTVVEYVLDRQDVHASFPVPVEYFPDTQLTHPAFPGASLYFQAGHAEHVPPFDPVHPTLQVQAPTPVLASGEFEFKEQSVHTFSDVACNVAENLPCTQFMHGELPAGLYVPALQ